MPTENIEYLKSNQDKKCRFIHLENLPSPITLGKGVTVEMLLSRQDFMVDILKHARKIQEKYGVDVTHFNINTDDPLNPDNRDVMRMGRNSCQVNYWTQGPKSIGTGVAPSVCENEYLEDERSDCYEEEAFEPDDIGEMRLDGD